MASDSARPDDFQPLTATMFHILLALADSEKHGYGILKAVEHETDGQISLLTGTLYRSLKRLLELGLVTESDERPDPDLDDERRRYYRITAPGQKALAAEAQRMARALTIMEHKDVLKRRHALGDLAGGAS